VRAFAPDAGGLSARISRSFPLRLDPGWCICLARRRLTPPFRAGNREAASARRGSLLWRHGRRDERSGRDRQGGRLGSSASTILIRHAGQIPRTSGSCAEYAGQVEGIIRTCSPTTTASSSRCSKFGRKKRPSCQATDCDTQPSNNGQSSDSEAMVKVSFRGGGGGGAAAGVRALNAGDRTIRSLRTSTCSRSAASLGTASSA